VGDGAVQGPDEHLQLLRRSVPLGPEQVVWTPVEVYGWRVSVKMKRWPLPGFRLRLLELSPAALERA
jgi:hypothetical protein